VKGKAPKLCSIWVAFGSKMFQEKTTRDEGPRVNKSRTEGPKKYKSPSKDKSPKGGF
jgi:hypothetical protein